MYPKYWETERPWYGSVGHHEEGSPHWPASSTLELTALKQKHPDSAHHPPPTSNLLLLCPFPQLGTQALPEGYTHLSSSNTRQAL